MPLLRLPRRRPLLRPPLPRVRLLPLLKVKQHLPRKPLRKKVDSPAREAAEGVDDVPVLCRRLSLPASSVTLRVPPKCIFSSRIKTLKNCGSGTHDNDAHVNVDVLNKIKINLSSIVDINLRLSYCYDRYGIYIKSLSTCCTAFLTYSYFLRALQLWTDCEHLYNCFNINNKFVLLK